MDGPAAFGVVEGVAAVVDVVVTPRADEDEVVDVGRAECFPVGDVVGVAAVGGCAAADAAAVACDQRFPLGDGCGAVVASDPDGCGGPVEEDGHDV